MTFQQFLQNIFYNEEKPFRSWAISTILSFVLYPLYQIPLLYVSLIFLPNRAVATVFIVTIIIGVILTPTIVFIDDKIRANKILPAIWILLIPILITIGSIPYSQYQQAISEDFIKINIPPFENASLKEIEYSPGNAWTSVPSTKIIFNLTDADSRLMDIIGFYNQELTSKGWIDDISEDRHHNEAYWESQPGYAFTGEDWYLKTGSNSTDYYKTSIQKSLTTNNSYSVNIIFHDCIDTLCKFGESLFEPTAYIMNSYRHSKSVF